MHHVKQKLLVAYLQERAWSSKSGANAASCAPTYLVKAGPPRPALELGGGRVGREIAHGAVERARPFGVVLDSVREIAREWGFSAPANHIALLYAQLSVLGGINHEQLTELEISRSQNIRPTTGNQQSAKDIE